MLTISREQLADLGAGRSSAPVMMCHLGVRCNDRALDSLKKEFVVKPQETVKWPRVIAGLPFIPEQVVTRREAELLDELAAEDLKSALLGHPSFDRLTLMKATAKDAFAAADRAYPPPNFCPAHVLPERVQEWRRNDGHNDAFRHAYWNALMAKRFGTEFAEDFGTSHEAVDGNPQPRMSMDLFNNSVGRRIAQENPDASDEELAGKVRQAVAKGEMVVLGADGMPKCSASVAPNEHGVVKLDDNGQSAKSAASY